MKAVRLIAVWFAIVGAISLYGYIESGLLGLLSLGGFGVGLATCIVMAWVLLARIRAGRLARGTAILIFWGVCMISVVLPVPVMRLPKILGLSDVHPFGHGAGIVAFGIVVWMFWTAVSAAVLFILGAIIVKEIEPFAQQ